MAIKYYGFLTEWFRLVRMVSYHAHRLGCLTSGLRSLGTRALPGTCFAIRTVWAWVLPRLTMWQAMLAGWPPGREPRPPQGPAMVSDTGTPWPPYDPADQALLARFDVFILQRIPEIGDHSFTIPPR